MNRLTGDPHITASMEHVLEAMLASPSTECTAVDIGRAAGHLPGTVHPVLAVLEAVGWIESRWEAVDPLIDGRPPRRRYRFSAEGARLSRQAILRAHRPRQARAWLSPTGCVA
jgi:DNA-binding IclR family transcriptional regulator